MSEVQVTLPAQPEELPRTLGAGDKIGSWTIVHYIGRDKYLAICSCGVERSLTLAQARENGQCSLCKTAYGGYGDRKRYQFSLNPKRVKIEAIRKAVCSRFYISEKELLSVRRSRPYARPRQLGMALARELTQRSLPDIGHRFGGRDHTTVLHACRRMEELRKTDPVWAEHWEALKFLLTYVPPPANDGEPNGQIEAAP